VSNFPSDVLIAGAGLGGACAALWLSETCHVTLVTGTAPVASTIAAGLINPFAGRRLNGVKDPDRLLTDLKETLQNADALDTYDPSGILRPALDKDQAADFRSHASRDHSGIQWLSPCQVKVEHPHIMAPYGAALTAGGILDTPTLLNSITHQLSDCSEVIQQNIVGWQDGGTYVNVTLDSGTTLKTQKLILALGAGYRSFRELIHLNLHCINGELVYIQPPDGMSLSMAVSGSGYVVPRNDHLILGTTYEHSQLPSQPTYEGMNKILTLTSKMIPQIESCAITGASAGVRVGVPGLRLPMVGPISDSVWILTGLGSKGLLFASHIGRNIRQWMTDPSCIPENFRVTNK